MFGSFFSGSFFLGKSIWGPIAPIRTNPDIDGNYIPDYGIGGDPFQVTTADTGAYNRTEGIISEFTPVDGIETGYFIQTSDTEGSLDRLK